MITFTKTNSQSESKTDSLDTLFIPETRPLIEFGEKCGWDFVITNRAPMPDGPEQMGNWLIVPAHQDSSRIPDHARERVEAILAAGLWPKGFIIAHEAPKLLPAQAEPVKPDRWRMPALSPQVRSFLKTIGIGGLLTAGLVLVSGLVLLALAFIVIAAISFAFVALAGAVLLVDPILIAVTDEDFWIEIDRWDVPAN